MANNCGNKVKHTCGTLHYATCTRYEGSVNPQSELAEDTCLDLEGTTQDIYNQLEDLNEQLDLSELGEKCLTYIEDEEDRIVVKNVLLKFEDEICTLKEKVEALENRQLCDFPIEGCDLDLSCLSLPCDTTISTMADLFQALINKVCEE